MHISYNERVRSYYGHSFEEGTDKTKVLMVGNSQARDFSNMLFEAGFLGDDDLVYRDDLEVCAYPALGAVDQELVERANVIFLVIDKLSDACKTMIASDAIERFNLIFVGPKHFGYNLNAFVRLEPEQRPLAVARIFDSVIKNNIENARSIPEARYIDLIAIASLDGVTIRIFDQEGNILSADREHVTKAGAVFFASRLLHDPSLDILR